MGAITIRLSDDLRSFLDEEVADGVSPDIDTYVETALQSHRARKLAALRAALAEGEASGILEGDGFEIIERTLAEARERYRSRTV